jgi:hypothetical protein
VEEIEGSLAERLGSFSVLNRECYSTTSGLIVGFPLELARSAYWHGGSLNYTSGEAGHFLPCVASEGSGIRRRF